MLFMPGNNPGMLQNAGILGSDCIILDLEDAVSITEKDSARILVRNALGCLDYSEVETVVRINPMDTAYGEQDIRELCSNGNGKPDGLMLSKATEEGIHRADRIINEMEEKNGFETGCIKIFPLIETAYALENIRALLEASPRITGVLLGAEDLTADLGIRRTKTGEEIFYARNRIATACRAFNIDAIDTPFTDLQDEEGFQKDIETAKSLGFTGKAAINPRQIDQIHQVFAPTPEELHYAKRVLAAVSEAERNGLGVFALDGKMIDAPIIARARTIIDKAVLMKTGRD